MHIDLICKSRLLPLKTASVDSVSNDEELIKIKNEKKNKKKNKKKTKKQKKKNV